jgi:hypothetical protein
MNSLVNHLDSPFKMFLFTMAACVFLPAFLLSRTSWLSLPSVHRENVVQLAAGLRVFLG